MLHRNEVVDRQVLEGDGAGLAWAALDSLPDGVAVLDREGNLLWVNRAWCEFSRRNGGTGKWEGMNYFDACARDEQDGPWILVGMKRVLAGDLPEFRYEYSCDSPFEKRWFVLRVTRLTGATEGLIASHLDITLRKVAEEAKAAVTTRYRLLAENLPDAYAHCQLIFEGGLPVDFLCLAVNPAFSRVTGLKEVVGKRVGTLIPGYWEHNREAFERYVEVALTGRTLSFERHIESHQAWVAITAFRPAEGEFIALFRDITEEKRQEASLKVSRMEKESLLQRQVARQTVAAVSHELNQPLGALSAYNDAALRILRSGGAPEQLDRILESSAALALRAGQTLHGLGEILKDNPFRVEPEDLGTVIRDAIALAHNDHDCPFLPILCLKKDLPAVLANASCLKQVLINLFRNGVAAMRESGVPDEDITLSIRSRAWNNQALVTVRDDGPGVAAEILPRIFDPFFTTRARHTGLGLSIGRTLIEAQGGRLWLEQKTGQGCSFHFTLPFA